MSDQLTVDSADVLVIVQRQLAAALNTAAQWEAAYHAEHDQRQADVDAMSIQVMSLRGRVGELEAAAQEVAGLQPTADGSNGQSKGNTKTVPQDTA